MTRSFTEGQITKGYLAIVRGFTGAGDRIDHPLKDRRDAMTGGEEEGDKPGKRSVTDYRRLTTVELPQPVGRYSTARYSFVAAAPMTGRTHQIRRHMKHIFHPVVGDTTYGDGKQNEFFRRTFNCRRLLLHASTISFVHPATGRQLSIHAPLDNTFCAVLEALHWDKVALV
jgi:tRNA pseudouridine65 synthase